MRKLLATLILLGYAISAYSQAPSNDCAESPIIINACGTTFSITQAQMANATNDSGCQAGGSCPINYVNGVGYENFDCNDGTGNSAGDDWNGTVENSLWWSFTTTESCSYTVTITATNCCCKEKGSTSAAQVHIFNTNGTLPSGTILGVLANNSNFTGTQNFTIPVVSGNPVLIGLDGLEGSDCDIAVSVMPTGNCSGCAVVMSKEDEKNPPKNPLKAKERVKNVEYFDIMGRSLNSEKDVYGIVFKKVTLVTGEQYIEKIFNY